MVYLRVRVRVRACAYCVCAARRQIAFGGVLLFISRLVKLSRDHKEWKAKQEKVLQARARARVTKPSRDHQEWKGKLAREAKLIYSEKVLT